MSASSSQPIDKGTRWEALALMRFALAIIVMLGHFSFYIEPDRYHLFGVGYFHPMGAVYGFLVLSGYSIAASLNREKTSYYVYFYMRRFVRIWPLYLACVLLGLVADKHLSAGIHWPQGQDWNPSTDKEVWGSLLMLQTFCQGPIPVIGPVWSLAVEWWFYMIAPFFKRHFKILLGLCVLSLSYFILGHHRIMNFLEVEEWTKGMPGKFSMAMGWIWIIGYIYYHFPNTLRGLVLLIIPALFAASVGRSPGVAYFLTVLVLAYSYHLPVMKKFSRLCNFLGDLSYPVYLFHMPVMALLAAAGYTNWLIMGLAVLALSALALYMIDYPARGLFRRLSARHETIAGH